MDEIIVIISFILYLIFDREIYFKIIFTFSFVSNFQFMLNNLKNNNFLKTFKKIIFVYLFSYYFIKDPNPFYHLLFFYLPFQNFFRAINIIIFINYELNNNKNNFFLSKYIYKLKNKKVLFNTIVLLSLIHFLIYMYNQKYFIYFMNKKDLISNEQKYYITANLFNNELIIKDWLIQMKLLINYLGTKNIYVSIFENGDSNDTTINELNNFRIYLNNLNIPNKIVTHKVTQKGNKERIVYLAELRNYALEFLYEIPNLDFSNTKIIFFNDIIYNYQDVIKLLLTNKGDYDVVCGMDYYESFYDTWVSIGIDGEEFRHYFPYQLNKVAQDIYINGENIRVFSCWNGLIIFNSKPLQNKKIMFRSGIKHRESECTLFNTDLYTMGYEKKLVNTQVVFAYEYDYYYKNKYLYPWTKNLITYFYYYFYYFFVDNNYNMRDIKSKHVELDVFLKDYYERYLIK